MAGKSEAVKVNGEESVVQAPMGEIVDVTEAVFAQALETYVECRTTRDDAEARMKASVPAIATYVIANGSHEKPEHPDDAKLEYNGYRVAWLWANRFTPEPGVEWVQARLAQPQDGDDPEQLRQLLVPSYTLNRALWESLADAPESVIPSGVADRVRGGGYKPDIRQLASKTCTCGAKVHKTFKFCPMCGGDVAALFAGARKRKG
jgi:hypothetical protein